MIKHFMRFGMAFAAVCGATLLGVACGDEDPIDEGEQLADCAQICSRYGDCVQEVDLTACTDACEDRIEVDSAMAEQASSCESCLDDRTCAEVEDAGCFDECPVVALQD